MTSYSTAATSESSTDNYFVLRDEDDDFVGDDTVTASATATATATAAAPAAAPAGHQQNPRQYTTPRSCTTTSVFEHDRRLFIQLITTSCLQLPNVHRYALIESCRAARNSEHLSDMFVDALSESEYVPDNVKDELLQAYMIDHDWSKIYDLVYAAQEHDNDDNNDNEIDDIHGDYDDRNHGGDPRSNDNIEAEMSSMFGFRDMVLCILYSSRKIAAAASADDDDDDHDENMVTLEHSRSSRTGGATSTNADILGGLSDVTYAILRTKDHDELLDLLVTTLASSTSIIRDENTRTKIVDDVLDGRYYRLLLPDRFDCIETTTASRRSQHEHCDNDDRTTTMLSSKKKEITTTIPSSSSSSICVICLGGCIEPMRLSNCHHEFCNDCLSLWSGTCHDNHNDRSIGALATPISSSTISCPLCRMHSPMPWTRMTTTPPAWTSSSSSWQQQQQQQRRRRADPPTTIRQHRLDPPAATTTTRGQQTQQTTYWT